jgi:hypothetical protein
MSFSKFAEQLERFLLFLGMDLNNYSNFHAKSSFNNNSSGKVTPIHSFVMVSTNKKLNSSEICNSTEKGSFSLGSCSVNLYFERCQVIVVERFTL